MAELTATKLLETPSVTVRDVHCRGSHRHPREEESAGHTQLVFPYRGFFVHHAGAEGAAAEANQVLFFNAGEGYRVSHPVPGGDDCLAIVPDESVLAEIAPRELLRRVSPPEFRHRRLRIDARAQVLVALLRYSLVRRIAEPLEAESLALTVMQRSLAPRISHAPGASAGRRRLVDRAKQVLASDPARRWTLAEIAAAMRVSPVYLTQVFRQVEGMPLYRYQLNLRLARALDLIGRYEDLSALGQDLGFSSHSHFSAAFQRAYGRTPSEFRRSALKP
jgi:AraC family transcriptional regulator